MQSESRDADDLMRSDSEADYLLGDYTIDKSIVYVC